MKEGRVISLYKKPLGPKDLRLSTYENELLAVVMAVTKWRHYLYGHYFIINTDQQSIKYSMEQKITIVLQQRCLMKLLGFDYTINYKKVLDNKAADALSRLSSSYAQCNTIHVSSPTWAQEINNSCDNDVGSSIYSI